MADCIRAFAWESTSIGTIAEWPPPLLSAVNIVLSVQYPMLLFWGQEMLQLYNDAFRPILTDRHPTALGMPARVFWTDVWHVVGEQLETVLRDGKDCFRENALVPTLRNGVLTDSYFDYSYSPVYGANGTVAGVLTICRDVTSNVAAAHERSAMQDALRLRQEETVRANQALAESERRLRALVNATSYSTFSVSPDWSEVRQFAGKASTNREWLQEYVYPADQPVVLRNIEDAIRTKNNLEVEHRVRRADGSLGWTLTRAVPLIDPKGEVTEWFGTASDVTDRKGGDESRFRLAAIVESADDAIISKDLNGIVKTWNQGAYQMFGYTADEMIGQPLLRLIPTDLRYEEDEILRKLRAGQRIDHYETIRMRKNGETIEVSVTISPIRNEVGEVIGASKIARDISDRRRIERLLIQSEKLAATGRMAAAIAHEINNPLESLMNLIYLARQNSPVEAKAHRYLLTAEEELERVSHIARQTLGYYRDTGAPTEVYLHDLIENVLTVYASKFLASEVAVDVRFNDLQKIVVSRGEMLQVFSNLIANAVDAMRQGGTLTVSTRNIISSGGNGIQIVIRDNGTGISQDHLPMVFEPFFTTKGNLGTGIGLWVSKQLVETRGGQISIASNTEQGKSGTAVTVFIPFGIPSSRTIAERE